MLRKNVIIIRVNVIFIRVNVIYISKIMSISYSFPNLMMNKDEISKYVEGLD